MERKKKSLIIIGVCILVLSVVGISYAFWQFRAFQTDEDRLASSCFQVTLTDEKNPISLPKAYPISDEEGHELTPYEFTITNVCTTSLTYQVNLETLSLEEGQKPLPEQYIKVQLDDRTPTLLNSYESVTQTIENATASHRLTTGILDGEHKSVTYHLRLWLEETTPAIDDVMNAYFKSKITVTATYKSNEQLKNDVNVLAKSNTDIYNEESESITLTATSDKYDLTEYKISERQETQNWKPISKKDKTFTVTETFTKAGTYYFTVKDEVGNEKEQEFEVTKIDTTGPDISYTETNNYQSVELKITLKDSQSGLVKYQVIKEDLTPIALLSESTPEPPESWTEIENTKEEQVITKTIEDNGVYYIFAQDAMGHTSSMKYSTEIIDKDPPTIELSNELITWGASDTIHIKLSDEKAGLFGYQVMKEEKNPESWETIENNPKSHSIDYTVTENGTYYIYAKDAYNNVSHDSISINWVDNNSPVANLKLSVNGKTITADASGSTDSESNIASYEYKLDDSEEWTSGDNSHEFIVPKYGKTHKVTLRVKDVVGNVNEVSQTIYISGLATDVIKDVEIVTTGNGLYEVPHTDQTTMDAKWQVTELRYAGVNPDNYVRFNNELWRIIGLVNVKTTSGIQQRIKIIRADPIKANEKDFSWDYKDDGIGSSTSDTGSNDWTDSQLMEMLNDGYYNSSSDVSCYKGSNGSISSQTTCQFDGTDTGTKGLEESARDMIDKDIIWNLGGSSTYNDVTVSMFYERERGTSAYTKGLPFARVTEWQASNTGRSSAETTSTKVPDSGLFKSIALPYPSDYGYATSGGETGRDGCFAKALYNWNSEDYQTQCASNDWLKPGSGWMWTLSPYSPYSNSVFAVLSSGFVNYRYGTYYSYGVLPALYLSFSVSISGGTGTSSLPFQLTAG